MATGMQVVRLAKKLPQGDVRVMAQDIGGLLPVTGLHQDHPGDEEEDLT
jgi:hypothetical protein